MYYSSASTYILGIGTSTTRTLIRLGEATLQFCQPQGGAVTVSQPGPVADFNSSNRFFSSLPTDYSIQCKEILI